MKHLLKTMTILFACVIFISTPAKAYTNMGKHTVNSATATVTCDYKVAYEILDIVNSERKKEGLSPLAMDEDLLEAAMMRSAECSIKFDHTRPNGKRCFSACDKMNGENIAMHSGSSASADSAMSMWMGSSGHRANILGSYKSIGIGCAITTGGVYYTQCFGGSDIAPATKSTKKEEKTYKIDASASSTYYMYHIEPLVKKSKKSKTLFWTSDDTLTVAFIDFYPQTTFDNLNFTSNRPEVASVSKNGTITGHKPGVATIEFTFDGTTYKENIAVSNNSYLTLGNSHCDVFDSSVKKNTTYNATTGYQFKVKKNGTAIITKILAQTNRGKVKEFVVPAFISDTKGRQYPVTEIAKNAAKNNTSLRSVILSSELTTIGKDAFKNCKNLKSIYVLSPKLKTIKSGAFSKTPKSAKVYTPKGKCENYKKKLKKGGFRGSIK